MSTPQWNQIQGVSLGASLDLSAPKLGSGVKSLDHFLQGGFVAGKINELGMPLGKNARRTLCPFLAKGIEEKQANVLWIHGYANWQIYPLAWYASGIPVERIFFASTQDPMKQLKPAFMSSYFKIIVLDFPHRLRKEECAFLGKLAEKHQRFFFLLRPYFLSNKRGNIWSKVRINVDYDYRTSCYRWHGLKGIAERQISFSSKDMNSNS